MKTSSKRLAAKARAAKVKLRAEQLPSPPYLKNDELTDNGKRLVEMAALGGDSQNRIAAHLGVTRSAFQKMLGRADEPTAARLCWEKGESQKESFLTRVLMARAANGDSNAATTLLRFDHQRRDSGGPSVQVDGPRINIVLPGPMSSAEYYAKLGITGPVDVRESKTIRDHMLMRGQSETEISDYLKKICRDADAANFLNAPKLINVTPKIAPTPTRAPTPTPQSNALTPANGMSVSPGFNSIRSY